MEVSDTSSGGLFALYPMVEQDQATGTVAAVYAQVVDVLPFVPSVFKSLAVCPTYLALAWEQAHTALSDVSYRVVADRLVASVHTAAMPPQDPQARDALAEFVNPLGQMLLLCAGWREALAGRLDGAPAQGGISAATGSVPPQRQVPSLRQTDADTLYGEICAALRTPLINSIWRNLAARGLLETAWRDLAPQVDLTRHEAAGLAQHAVPAAHGVEWPVVADPVALRMADIDDAAPGMAAILDCYLTTLPRVLTLVACCRQT